MGMIGMFSGLNISASGLRAQRVRQNVISSNLANAETTRTKEGGPYRRQSVILRADPIESETRFVFPPEKLKGNTTQDKHMFIPQNNMTMDPQYVGSGVEIVDIQKDGNDPKKVYNPEHPDANKEGYVEMPNINIVQEMTDMITATRAYEANVTAFNSTKAMIMKALEL